MPNYILAKHVQRWFINEAKHGNDVRILRLRNKLCNSANDFKTTLSVGDAHRPIHKIHSIQHAGMVEPVLGTWERVEIKVDTKSVLACPSYRFYDVSETKSKTRRSRLFRAGIEQAPPEKETQNITVSLPFAGRIRIIL